MLQFQAFQVKVAGEEAQVGVRRERLAQCWRLVRLRSFGPPIQACGPLEALAVLVRVQGSVTS